MKRYLLFCQLTLLPAVAAQAQFVAGQDGLFIASETQVAINGLTIRPSADFTLADRSLTISSTPVRGNPPGIGKVYSFSSPIDFAGNLGFFYLPTELNGNEENNLQLAHGNETFVTTAGSTVVPAQGYISNNLSSLTNLTFVTASQEGALPVSLIGFQVSRVENLTLLNWQTTDEKNSDFFEVQQSTDARKWNALGKVTAARESRNFREYSFQDPAFRSGRQYYRLKMVDADGSYAYSEIRSVHLTAVELVSAYPNPVTEKLLINATGKMASMKLTDLSGRQLLNLPKPVSGQEVNMKNYPAGTYLVQFTMTDGQSQVVKVVKR
ncbi:T9SS type A sorting domain-containing protein [Dyadobacter aurulentus]|uniref:T9SS type A sorting domain-containing protein n=1 Tax=Dyadobacter sp. UC 10 TaxID=2605428 RepID=UPI0011F1F1B8|nr:T9SS type A sorting domain-containing protein [Dyadobacter sp. UC 10]KAA0992674.1 T9SS type A sorting domain-containing protein [Dyadobacter sp. UC 10]